MDHSEEKKQELSGKKEAESTKRRDLIKGLATVPVLGAFAYSWLRKRRMERLLNNKILSEIKITSAPPELNRGETTGKKIRIGLIGQGGRGQALARAAGFAHPGYIDAIREAGMRNSNDKRYADYLVQEDLNIEITAVCDVFTVNAQKALEAGANIQRGGSGDSMGNMPREYKTYQELLAAGDVDAVIIATPDHWHGPMTIAAAKAGKHVYCEKPMSWTVEETYEIEKAVKENGIVFQLGHQNRQIEAYYKAREAIRKDLLGKVSLIEVTTNRNSPNGAWVYPIHPEASRETIDWEQFIGPAPWHDFSLERFFRWRCWWDYSTGLSGDLLTHDYDAMNQIMDLGIPGSAVSSGGIYYYKDGRTVPDVLHSVFEYPEKDLSLMYSATLASSRPRGRVIMGHDAVMEVGSSLNIYVDSGSTRYKDKLKEGTLDPNLPLYTYSPGRQSTDAITSATQQYFAGRGLLYTYRGGKRMDTSFLHIREWLTAIRNGGTTSCNIDRGFEEAMTAHMGTLAYKENRKVFWDSEKRKII